MQMITLGLFAILTQHNLSGHLVFVDTLVNHLFHQLLALLHYLLHQLAYSNQLMLYISHWNHQPLLWNFQNY